MIRRCSAPAMAVAFAFTAFANGPGGPEETGALKAAVPAKWEIVTPVTAAVKLTAGPAGVRMIPIPHSGGPGFVVESDGPSLSIDTNGDGKFDDKVKGVGGTVSLKGKTAEGVAFSYAVRITNDGTDWVLSPAGVMQGRVAGTDVKLIDLNLNGRFDEIGVDGMVVGKSEAAGLLSKVTNLGGKLFNLTVSADGASATATPFEGNAGTLNLAKGWKSDGAELVSAVVASENDELSFELSDARTGLLVPAGEYKLVYGFARKGSESVKIRGGANTKRFPVEAGKDLTATWGGAVEMDFTFSITKDVITVPPDLRYVGAGGEEYFEFKPDAKSPQIVVFDPTAKQVVREGRFGGC